VPGTCKHGNEPSGSKSAGNSRLAENRLASQEDHLLHGGSE
jgi:hypothetical protein